MQDPKQDPDPDQSEKSLGSVTLIIRGKGRLRYRNDQTLDPH
jgi:hypothetical protein